MAVDDVATVITANMAQNDTTDRQPGSGVEELMLSLAALDIDGTGPDEKPSAALNLIDGTNNDAFYYTAQTAGVMPAFGLNGKFMGDNTNYFRVTQTGATTGDYGFAVIQVG